MAKKRKVYISGQSRTMLDVCLFDPRLTREDRWALKEVFGAYVPPGQRKGKKAAAEYLRKRRLMA